jgi:predicted PurR-regulated permease PerM
VYLLGGWVLCGPIGLFVGPVLVSLFLTALQIYREEYDTADVPSDTPVAASPTVAP